jgi:hypothetical protein
MADSPLVADADAQATILASRVDETDSAYDEDSQSLTTSLSSTKWNYNYEIGRSYSSFLKVT